YDVVCCDACGFVYADTVADQSQFDEYYARLSKYEDGKVSTGGGDNPSDRARLAGLAETLATVFPDRSTRFIDIGCATGGFLAALQRLGYYNLCGIDAASRCCEQTRRRTGAEVHMGTFSSMPTNIGPGDVVTLCAVLEHVRDVHSALAAVRPLLRPHGAMF